MKNIDSEIAQLAADFFAQKNLENYYYVNAFNDDFCEDVYYVNHFTPEEFEMLKDLRAKYGDGEFHKHLDEVYDDADTIYDLSCGREIIGIDLDNCLHRYTFTIHSLGKSGLSARKVLVTLSDEAYIKLLALCVGDKGMNYNKLYYADGALYTAIRREIDSYQMDDIFFIGDEPYLVTMDEVKADADAIRTAHPECDPYGIAGYCVL